MGKMLPSSVRRVVSAAPQSPLLSGFAHSSARATAAASISLSSTARSQQRRRYSSSKPSNPNDSSKGIPNGANGDLTASPAQPSKSSVEKRSRRKTKEVAPPSNLPSVPSTQHIPQEAMALSSFFSQHRPISVTQGFPKAVTHDAFAQIFASRTKAKKHEDVIETLESTVRGLEQPMQRLSMSNPPEPTSQHDNMHRMEFRHQDGTDSAIYFHLNTMSGQYLPFRPPPAPQPDSETSASAETGAEEAVEEASQTRVYKAIFTLEETTEPNGEVRIMAHSPTLIEEDGYRPRSFLDRMALRQLKLKEARGRAADRMIAISVKRQRKLKMKKKKYKKLMKRTRNVRRKLDRV